MSVTLAQAQLNVQDDIQSGVIDEFRKNNFLLDHMTFDDVVNPSGGGATMTYGYNRVKTQPSAAFRAINAEYTASEMTKEQVTVDLKVFGGSFQIDRVLVGMRGLIDEVQLQLTQKIKAASSLFSDTAINGSVVSDANAFDGLDIALTDSDTEYNDGATIDLSTSAKIDDNFKTTLDAFDAFFALLDGKPDALLMNSAMLAKMKAIARRAGYYSRAEDAFGKTIDTYDGIPLIDLGAKPAATTPIVTVNTRTVATVETTGLTDIFAVRLGMDGFHGVTYAGKPFIQTWLPDFRTAGAVKTGEVEMVAAIALKATKAAGVFRNFKVQ